jgi:ABC-type nitrate/sulfonate/bicarbonate transport system ATPase subunit
LNDTPPIGANESLDVTIERKRYTQTSRVEILRNIHFALRAGEVAAIFGPSGCGKTTILRIVAGLDTEFDGAIRRPDRGRIGMVFQEPRLLPWRTVEQNIRIAAPQVTEAALQSLLDTFGLAAHRAHYPGQLSLGLARRVALARAFAVEPEILLLDEPFASLDAALADKLRAELAMLIESRPLTTLLVTHDLDEAILLADRILLLSGQPSQLSANIPIRIARKERTAKIVAAIRKTLSIPLPPDGRREHLKPDVSKDAQGKRAADD